MRGLRFAFPCLLSIFEIVWWFSWWPNFDGVIRPFKVIRRLFVAVRRRALSLRKSVFRGRPIRSLFWKVISPNSIVRRIKELIVVRGIPIFLKILVFEYPLR